MLRESLLWAEVEERGNHSPLVTTSVKDFVLVSFNRSSHMCFQVEQEATDKDNKNCSKDGMCGKVRLWIRKVFFQRYKLLRPDPDPCLCCRTFSSCWGTEEMGERRWGRLSLTQLSVWPDPVSLSHELTWSSFTLH